MTVRGAGTKQSWGAPPRATDVVLSTTRPERAASITSPAISSRPLPAGASLDAVNDVLRRERQWLPLDPPRSRPRDHRRHRRDQRQRSAAPPVRRAARSDHRHRDRARRRAHRQGRRPRRQECRGLRPVEAAVRIARQPRRRSRARRSSCRRSPPASQTRRRDARRSRAALGELALAIADAPLDAVGDRAAVAAPSPAHPVRNDRPRGRRAQVAAAASLCAAHGATTEVADRTGRSRRVARARAAASCRATDGTIVKLAILPTDVAEMLSRDRDG